MKNRFSILKQLHSFKFFQSDYLPIIIINRRNYMTELTDVAITASNAYSFVSVIKP